MGLGLPWSLPRSPRGSMRAAGFRAMLLVSEGDDEGRTCSSDEFLEGLQSGTKNHNSNIGSSPSVSRSTSPSASPSSISVQFF